LLLGRERQRQSFLGRVDGAYGLFRAKRRYQPDLRIGRRISDGDGGAPVGIDPCACEERLRTEETRILQRSLSDLRK